MEKLTINIPDDKSSLVKQILQELGVTIDRPAEQDTTSYKKKLSKVSHWTADDVKVFEEAKSAFDDFKVQKW